MTTSVSQRLNSLCVKLKIGVLFIITLSSLLYVRVDILLTCGKHLQDCIFISVGQRVGPIKIALSNHFLSSLECEQSCTCICVFWGGGGEDINLANVSTIFRLDFEIVL